MTVKDLEVFDKERILIFQIAYNYNINLNSVLQLRDMSKDLFWTFLNVFAPLLKVGTRKVGQFNKVASKFIDIYKGNFSILDLNEQEAEIYSLIELYFRKYFTDGDKLFTIPTLANRGSLDAYKEDGTYIGKGLDVIKEKINDIDYITLNRKIKLVKCSRINYLIDKLCNNMTIKEIRSKSIKELVELINEKSK